MAAGETESDGETGAGGEHRGRAEVLQKGVRFLRMEAPVGVTQPSSHLTLPPAPGIFSGSPLGPAKAWEYPRGEGKNKLHSFIQEIVPEAFQASGRTISVLGAQIHKQAVRSIRCRGRCALKLGGGGLP